ncbi:nucleotidyltransferase family protein [Pseudooceanicola algae]|uniref:N-acetylmuramate alpha-1-phosphate uridylyltransferase n=1 Tax=Pseudooceanicola algae TaxID=1537215 RepID=A0A418SG01_9RHOB|nr:nucleotidyltransferase family protein [Pseudooceanicola algae]QPM91495.1 N-acetylmuramate alpha-1-phosphate uridylyltransferase [Pseudooceanicola algae]
MPAALMLFAAGFGTRMRPLTDSRPKPLIPVAGRALIDHARDQAAGLPSLVTVANAHYMADQVEGHLAGTGVTVNRESPDILDTGGGLLNALPLLGNGPVFCLNTDAVWAGPPALKVLLEGWDPERMDGLLLCVSPDNSRGHPGTGDFTLDAEGRVTPGAGLNYTGAQILKTDLLSEIEGPAFSVWKLWERMIARKRLFAQPYPGLWCDVGRPENIAEAEAMLNTPDV